MARKVLSIAELMTPQEHILSGSTPRIVPDREHPDNWYVPISVLAEKLTIEEANSARQKIGHMIIGPMIAVFIKPRVSLLASLAALDPETGQTVEDPVINCVWNTETNKTEDADLGPKMTGDLYKVFEDYKTNLRLRPTSSTPEGQQGSNPEQR